MCALRLETPDTLSVNDYVNIVRNVWSPIHKRRTTLGYAFHLFDHASKLGEAIRKDELNEIFSEIAELTNWLFGFVAKLNDSKSDWEAVFNINVPFSDMIWAKYPWSCGHCIERKYLATGQLPKRPLKKCSCLMHYPKVEYRKDKDEAKEVRRQFARDTKKYMPLTLGMMEKMFHAIYGANTSIWTIESIGFHLLEEVGEIGRALEDLFTLRGKEQKPSSSIDDLCDEIAESFSWICSLTLKLSQLFQPTDKYYKGLMKAQITGGLNLAKTIRLEWSLWLKYRDSNTHYYRCPYCNQSPCIEDPDITFAWEK